jgi:hypothetical protein
MTTSAYPRTYTFTREQLLEVLEDVFFEAQHAYEEIKAEQGKRHAKAQRHLIIDGAITDVMTRLDFDATRPQPPASPPRCPMRLALGDDERDWVYCTLLEGHEGPHYHPCLEATGTSPRAVP